MSKTNLPPEAIKSEFKEDPDYYVIFSTNGLIMGRIIAESKGEYCKEHQGELIIFNANIIIKKQGKIWYGDININLDFDKLKNIADKLKEDLYILLEGDARFGYENQSIDILISKAKAIIKCKPKIIKKENNKKPKTNLKSRKNDTNNRSTK